MSTHTQKETKMLMLMHFITEFWRRHDALFECVSSIKALTVEFHQLHGTVVSNYQNIKENLMAMKERLVQVDQKLTTVTEKVSEVGRDVTFAKGEIEKLKALLADGDPEAVALVDSIDSKLDNMVAALTQTAEVINSDAPPESDPSAQQ